MTDYITDPQTATPDSSGTDEKITHKTGIGKKSPTRQGRKSPTRRDTESPRYINQRGVSPVGVGELRQLLQSIHQDEWITPKRLEGLMLLLDFLTRHLGAKERSIGVALAEDYVSEIKRRRHQWTERAPLNLLCQIGILRRTKEAVTLGPSKMSACYRLHDQYARKQPHEFEFTPGQQKKREAAWKRKGKREGLRYPFKPGIEAALDQLSFAESARPVIWELQDRDPNKDENKEEARIASIKRTVRAIDEKQHYVKPDKTGQISTPLSSLPTELKPHLLLGGEKAEFADISYAHHCFLPKLLAQRIEYLRRKAPGADLSRLESERDGFIAFLSEGDYYKKACTNENDPDERERIKKLFNCLLNFPNAKALKISDYLKMRDLFPHTFKTLEDIKKTDHRKISQYLRHFTAEAVRVALEELMRSGVLAIPQTDALLVQTSHFEAARLSLSRAVFQVSGGVCCKVGGIRYRPEAKLSAA